MHANLKGYLSKLISKKTYEKQYHCPVCKHPSKNEVDLSGFQFAFCSHCFTLFRAKLPAEELDQNIVSDSGDYYFENTNLDTEVNTNKNRFSGFFKKYQLPNDRIFEVGFGLGMALKAFKDMGYRPYGCEIAKSCFNYAKKTLKLNDIYHCSLEDLKIKDKFGFILALHVLEHLRDPYDLVKFCDKYCAKQGYILVEIPYIYSYESLKRGIEWRGLSPHVHNFFFSMEALEKLFHNYQIITVQENISPDFYDLVLPYLTKLTANTHMLDASMSKYYGGGHLEILLQNSL